MHDLDDGTCLTVYSVDAEPAVLALVIGGAARAALGHLPDVLGVDRPPVTPGRHPDPNRPAHHAAGDPKGAR